MIEYARSLVAAERPIDYYSCFICYSSHDEALAERLYADLQAKGVRCWLAPHDLTPGEVIVRGIDEAICIVYSHQHCGGVPTWCLSRARVLREIPVSVDTMITYWYGVDVSK